jgi:Pirin-related protein
MIDIRRFDRLGRFDNEWLNARYHFSFSGYMDRNRMGHGALRVWNDDKIRAGTGFPPHPHDNMEIITYVRTGAITHRDSLGNEGRTEAGDVQVMSAGSGIRHSEVNLEDVDTTLFQIWILPNERNGKPFWGAKKFPKADRANEWSVLASGDASDEGLPIRQDAKVLGATLEAGKTLEIKTSAGRYGYLVLAAGSVKLGDTVLNARDAVAITGPETVSVTADADAELVLVDTI